jgi:hypothetical protein
VRKRDHCFIRARFRNFLDQLGGFSCFIDQSMHCYPLILKTKQKECGHERTSAASGPHCSQGKRQDPGQSVINYSIKLSPTSSNFWNRNTKQELERQRDEQVKEINQLRQLRAQIQNNPNLRQFNTTDSDGSDDEIEDDGDDEATNASKE